MRQTRTFPPRVRDRRLGGRLITGFLIATLVLGAPSSVEAAEKAKPEPAMGLAELLDRAEQQNPAIRAAEMRGEAARAKAGYAGALEAPRVKAALMDVATLGGPSLGVSQMFPGGLKRALMTEAADREAAMIRAEVDQRRLSIARDLRQAYYEHVYLNRAHGIYLQTLEQVRNLRRIADARYAVGSGLHQDAIRAQRELSMLLDRGLMLDSELEASRARINTLANRAVDAALQVPEDLPALPAVMGDAELLARAETHSPELKALRARVEAQEAMLALSREEKGAPDFEVGVETGRSVPGNMSYLGGMVGITLPWLNGGRFDARIRESEAGLAAAQAAYQAQRLGLRGEIRQLRVVLLRSERQIKLYEKGLRPQSLQALQAALAAYQVAKVDFDTVLESQTAIYQVQTDEARAKADYHQTLASLEALIGAPISAAPIK